MLSGTRWPRFSRSCFRESGVLALLSLFLGTDEVAAVVAKNRHGEGFAYKMNTTETLLQHLGVLKLSLLS